MRTVHVIKNPDTNLYAVCTHENGETAVVWIEDYMYADFYPNSMNPYEILNALRDKYLSIYVPATLEMVPVYIDDVKPISKQDIMQLTMELSNLIQSCYHSYDELEDAIYETDVRFYLKEVVEVGKKIENIVKINNISKEEMQLVVSSSLTRFGYDRVNLDYWLKVWYWISRVSTTSEAMHHLHTLDSKYVKKVYKQTMKEIDAMTDMDLSYLCKSWLDTCVSGILSTKQQ